MQIEPGAAGRGELGIIGNTAEEFAAQYAQTFEVMASLVRDAGLQPE